MKCGRHQSRTAFLIGAFFQHDMRWQIHAAIGNCRCHCDELDRSDANFLAHGDGADCGRLPAIRRFQQAARLTWKFNLGLLSKSIIVNVLIETILAQALGKLNGYHLARFRQSLPRRQRISVVAFVDHGVAIVMHNPPGNINLAAKGRNDRYPA